MELNKIKKIYMIGIKGVGMTMLAQYFAAQGIEVLGSDIEEKFMTDEVLKKSGIRVIEKFDAKNIPKDADLIIYSSAYNAENNAEVGGVVNPPNPPFKGGRILTYAQALGEVFNQKYGIAVIGSHGKTTTTAWLGFVMREAGINPNVMAGASVPQFGGAALISVSDYLIIEADEYQNKFVNLQPKAVILNNIDYDHPDFFKDEKEYINVFVEFIKKIPKKGFLIANYDDPIIRKIANVNCMGKVITYAINEAADYVAYDIRNDNPPTPLSKGGIVNFPLQKRGEGGLFIKNSQQYFKVKLGVDEGAGNELGDFSINLQGKHNISNALAVIATCVELGMELVDVRKYLSEFIGAARRMQVMGEFKGATIIDDYAHHPTEIKAALAGAREVFQGRKIKVVFHPHTFTRTKALLDDFAESFGDADEVIVLDIYGSAREEHGGVHSRDLVAKIKNQTNTPILQSMGVFVEKDNLNQGRKSVVKYIPSLKQCEEYLRENIKRGDVVVLMGAGDVFRIGENLVKP